MQNPKNGVNFVTNEDLDKSLWHAYTMNSDYNVSTSSWVPCVDSLSERCTWSLEVNIPRTIRDIGNPRIIGTKEALKYEQNQQRGRITNATGQSRAVDEDKTGLYHSLHDNEDDDEVVVVEDDVDDDGEVDEEDLSNSDLVVVSGDFNNVKETPHPIDQSKKVVSWSILTQCVLTMLDGRWDVLKVLYCLKALVAQMKMTMNVMTMVLLMEQMPLMNRVIMRSLFTH